jgi:hypothetical protein
MSDWNGELVDAEQTNPALTSRLQMSGPGFAVLCKELISVASY